MKVLQKCASASYGKKNEDRDFLKIEIDGTKEFNVYDGEVEDADLSHNFIDCWRITELMKKAFEAGKAGEEFEVEVIELDEDD